VLRRAQSGIVDDDDDDDDNNDDTNSIRRQSSRHRTTSSTVPTIESDAARGRLSMLVRVFFDFLRL